MFLGTYKSLVRYSPMHFLPSFLLACSSSLFLSLSLSLAVYPWLRKVTCNSFRSGLVHLFTSIKRINGTIHAHGIPKNMFLMRTTERQGNNNNNKIRQETTEKKIKIRLKIQLYDSCCSKSHRFTSLHQQMKCLFMETQKCRMTSAVLIE